MRYWIRFSGRAELLAIRRRPPRGAAVVSSGTRYRWATSGMVHHQEKVCGAFMVQSVADAPRK
ncbi:hypothetical protein GCM10018781_52650 [Kitasatospora indigofera]|uniref:Uncharacterized protein n=1 Tax=Kitasatospora indigofera TaxID=67307 RepID=A0A919G504_9ACTN|nr:hypothetical protein A6A07_28120 [Streptomyces sp. CB03911]GHH78006.1 hypothetical protein GCM10018781_52650 [Kitasatospora indigofera]